MEAALTNETWSKARLERDFDTVIVRTLERFHRDGLLSDDDANRLLCAAQDFRAALAL